MKLNYKLDLLPLSDTETTKDLKLVLSEIIPEDCRYCLLHSSLMTFKGILNPLQNSIRAIVEISKERGVTFALPTYTPKALATNYFSLDSTSCETGILPETFRKLYNTILNLRICYLHVC